MAICMDTRTDNHNCGIIDSYGPCEIFETDFYNGLCKDLAKELDFPDQTDLRRISQLELFGSSWDTDPYQQLLLRCLGHSLPRLREQPPAIPRSRSFSIDCTDTEEDEVVEDEGLDAQLPTNPPPSPALSPTNCLLSAEDDLEPMSFEKVQLLPPSTDSQDLTVGGQTAGENTKIQRTGRQSTHRRVASTGLLATVVTGDGSVTWHFKKF